MQFAFCLAKFVYLLVVSCDFDLSRCGFEQDKTDKFDWIRRTGNTPSKSTGPSADHTGKGGLLTNAGYSEA